MLEPDYSVACEFEAYMNLNVMLYMKQLLQTGACFLYFCVFIYRILLVDNVVHDLYAAGC